MTSLLHRLAANAPVPVYAVTGAGSRSRVQDLRLASALNLVDTPRAANVLLIAGSIAREHAEALARVHDALPHPRTTLLWDSDAAGLVISDAALVEAATDPVATIRSLFGELVDGTRPTEPPILPDEEPALWRGVGPYGQGGSGMTGGTPYGRPLAELGPDRDGLRLDVLPTQLGPFFAPLPAGLVLDLRVAGDLLVEANVTHAAIGAAGSIPAPSPFTIALDQPVLIAELELERARDHLRWLADALHTQGLPALGLRALTLAHSVEPGMSAEVRRFAGRVARTGAYRWSLPPTRGRFAPTLVGLALGPVSRAAGFADDARLDDPAYRALGFEPILGDRDDASSRWQLRIEEAARSLDLAARAGDARTTVRGVVEGPRGRLAVGDAPTQRALSALPALLGGLEWGDAIATLVSLDLDLDELASTAVAHSGTVA